MLAAFQAKRIADVLLIDGQSMPDLAALGVIAPYDDLDKGLMEKWKPNFVPEIWNSTVVNGKFYGPSSYVDMGSFLVYNKQMFDEAGIKQAPANWDEVKEAAKKLTKPDRAGITLNFNTVPDDPRPPFQASGVRIGTPAVTTQGMREPEMAEIAALIGRTLRGRDDDAELSAVRDDVAALSSKFTPYPPS